MSNHNFIKILSDKQWYNFMCGLLVGYRSFKPDGEVPDVIVGGSGKIGQQALAVQYDSKTLQYDIPVFTHDVDISYSGFLSIIRWNPNDLYVKSISEGTAGSLSYGTQGSKAGYAWYQLKPGELIVDKLLPYGQAYDQEEILFIIHAVVMNAMAVNSGIKIQVIPKTIPVGIASDDDSVLSAWVTDTTTGLFDLKYITPEVNVDGGIFGDIPRYSVPLPVNIPTKSGNFRQGAEIGFYGTTQECLFDDTTYYHSQHLVIHDDLGRDIGIKEFDITYNLGDALGSTHLDVFSIEDILGENGWHISYSIDKTYEDWGDHQHVSAEHIRIHGTRDDYIKETHTAFTFIFKTNPVHRAGSIGIYFPVLGVYDTDVSAIVVNSYDTNYDFVSLKNRVQLYDENGNRYGVYESVVVGKQSGTQQGYQEYTMPVWSPGTQTIKIELPGGSSGSHHISYTYEVAPGWNYIPIEVPYVSPFKWESITIESSYYLLIHRIIKIRDGGSPDAVGPQEYQLSIIDDLQLEDFNSNTKNTRTIYTSDNIDDLLFEDANFNNTSKQRVLLTNALDDVLFNDYGLAKILGEPDLQDSESSFSVSDFVDVHIVQIVIHNNNTTGDLTFDDIVHTKILGEPDERTDIENIELSDEVTNNLNDVVSVYVEDELPKISGDTANIEDFMTYEITQ